MITFYPFTEGLGICVGWALLVAVDAKKCSIEAEGAIDGQRFGFKERHIKIDTVRETQALGIASFFVRWGGVAQGVRVEGVTLK